MGTVGTDNSLCSACSQTPLYKYRHTHKHVTGYMLSTYWTIGPIFLFYPFLVHSKVHLESSEDSSSPLHPLLQDTPNFLKGRTHFSTGQRRREGVVTDGHCLLCVVHIHLIKAEVSDTYFTHTKKSKSATSCDHFSPLRVQMLRSPLQLVPLEPKCADRQPPQRKKR